MIGVVLVVVLKSGFSTGDVVGGVLLVVAVAVAAVAVPVAVYVMRVLLIIL